MKIRLDVVLLEKVLKTVNASIYIHDFDAPKVEWINNCLPFLSKSMADGSLKENSDFKENLIDAKDFFIQNPNKRRYKIFRMNRADDTFSWVLTTAVVFEKDLKGIPQKAIATALDITELISSNDSLAMALGGMHQSRHQKVLGMLTKREKEIIRLLTEGLNTKEIAIKLKRSFHTIETHRGNIKNKLGCKNVAEIPAFGQMIGLSNGS